MPFFGPRTDVSDDPEYDIVGMSTKVFDKNTIIRPKQLTSRHFHLGDGCYRYIPPKID